jgi:hypothetical protein
LNFKPASFWQSGKTSPDRFSLFLQKSVNDFVNATYSSKSSFLFMAEHPLPVHRAPLVFDLAAILTNHRHHLFIMIDRRGIDVL